jgi:hypothetical protein
MASSQSVECLRKITTSALPFSNEHQIYFETMTDRIPVFLHHFDRENYLS